MYKYHFSFDIKHSHDIIVSARNKKEAKKKAIEKFIKKIKPSMFEIYLVRDTE